MKKQLIFITLAFYPGSLLNVFDINLGDPQTGYQIIYHEKITPTS